MPKDETNVTGRRLGNNIEYATLVYAPDMKALDEKIKLECGKKLFTCIGEPRTAKREYTRPGIKWTYTKNGRGSYYCCVGLYWLKEHAPQVIKREMVLVNEDVDDFDACDCCGHTISGKMYLLALQEGPVHQRVLRRVRVRPKKGKKAHPKAARRHVPRQGSAADGGRFVFRKNRRQVLTFIFFEPGPVFASWRHHRPIHCAARGLTNEFIL